MCATHQTWIMLKKQKANVVSYAHAQRKPSNTMKLVELFKILVGGDCEGTAMALFIKQANKLISKLHNLNYPLTLSPEDELAIKNMKFAGFVR